MTRPCEFEIVPNLDQTGRWFRQSGNIVIVLDNRAVPLRRLSRNPTIIDAQRHSNKGELDEGLPLVARVSPRTLTYTQADVIDNRISIPAQHSLVRLSKNPATSTHAAGLLAEVKAGRLAGIYCANWHVAAQRAVRLGKSWWTVIPAGEDSVLLLDPANLTSGRPLIAYRRELDPNCGLLKGEKKFNASPQRLDAALLKAGTSYGLWNASRQPGQSARCTVSPGNRATAELEFLGGARPLSNVIPTLLCQVSGQPAPAASPVLVPHPHVLRNCNSSFAWTSEPPARDMLPESMNPGFILSNGDIGFDKTLDDTLVALLLTKYQSLLAPQSVKERRPTEKDKIRVALVDLTGNKICRPGYAGWGSTFSMAGASTAKIAVFYAAHQLLFDLRELARVNSIRKTTDLIQKANEVWKDLKCKPDLRWLFAFDETENPIGIEKSTSLQQHLLNIVNEVDGTLMASELFLRLGFEYIASVLWQSGLRHPQRGGLWVGGTFCTGRRTARHDARCHIISAAGCPKGEDRVIWTNDALKVNRVVLTALSVATFFTLLAQERLVTETLSREIEGLLKNACSFIGRALPAGMIRAAKCGLVPGSLLHDGALIQNPQRRYVMVFLTANASMPDKLRNELVKDLDQLIKDNNP